MATPTATAAVTLLDQVTNQATGQHTMYGFAIQGGSLTLASATAFWVPNHPIHRAFNATEAATWNIWSTFPTIDPAFAALMSSPQTQAQAINQMAANTTVVGGVSYPTPFGPMTASGASVGGGASQANANALLIANINQIVQNDITGAQALPVYIGQTSPIGSVTPIGPVNT